MYGWRCPFGTFSYSQRKIGRSSTKGISCRMSSLPFYASLLSDAKASTNASALHCTCFPLCGCRTSVFNTSLNVLLFHQIRHKGTAPTIHTNEVNSSAEEVLPIKPSRKHRQKERYKKDNSTGSISVSRFLLKSEGEVGALNAEKEGDFLLLHQKKGGACFPASGENTNCDTVRSPSFKILSTEPEKGLPSRGAMKGIKCSSASSSRQLAAAPFPSASSQRTSDDEEGMANYTIETLSSIIPNSIQNTHRITEGCAAATTVFKQELNHEDNLSAPAATGEESEQLSSSSKRNFSSIPAGHSIETEKVNPPGSLSSLHNGTSMNPFLLSREKLKPSSPATPSSSSYRQAYEELLQKTYINPFNGKRLHVNSPTAKLLSSLGFVRREDNPLFVHWLPEIYMKTVEAERQKIEQKEHRKYQQQLKRYEKEKERHQRSEKLFKGRGLSTSKKRLIGKEEKESHVVLPMPPPPPSPPSIQEGVDKVLRPLEKKKGPSGSGMGVGTGKGNPPGAGDGQSWVDILLRSYDAGVDSNDMVTVAAALSSSSSTGSSSSWMAELCILLRRPDALTLIPRFLEQRYLDLTTSSVMPPKLDTSTTDFGMPLPLSNEGNGEGKITRKPNDIAESTTAGPLGAPGNTVETLENGDQKGVKEGGAGDETNHSSCTTLTVDQLNVLNLAQQGYSLFIGGSAGTGKTVLLRQIHKQLTQMGLRVAMTATTGVAAVQLGGCTFHHAFNAPIYAGGGGGLECWGGMAGANGMGISAELWNRRWDQTVLRAVDVVMIDEVSLLDAQTFDAFDMEARLARMSSEPFGGIQVLICGDFLQLSIGLQDALPAYLSTAFGYLMKVRLETPMRHRVGDPLLPLLNKVRRGEYDPKLFAPLDKAIPKDAKEGTPGEDGTGRCSMTFIFPRRRDAQRLNDAKLGELITMEKIFPPQRGPLRLSGDFTTSAFMEMLNGGSMPSRGKVLDVIRAEFAALLGEKLEDFTRSGESPFGAGEFVSVQKDDTTKSSLIPPRCSVPGGSSRGGVGSGYHTALLSALSPGTSMAALLPELDVVVMPAQTNVSLYSVASCTSSSSFFLRIRYPNRTSRLPCNASTAAGATSVLVTNHSTTSKTASRSTTSPEDRKQTERSNKNEDPAGVGNMLAICPSTSTRHRTGLLQTLLTNEIWEQLAHAVAARLSARVVSFFEDEPRSMIPLSVSMALADMTNNDIAQTLMPLRLKLGCRVMVNRNLSRRVSNGSVGTVEAFADPDPTLFPSRFSGPVGLSYRSPGAEVAKVIEAECFDQLPIVRLLDGSVVQIPPIPIHIGGTPLTYYYGHDVFAIPLQLGYAFTVHKVQGLTLQGTVVLDCKNFFDCPHLVYVACSRVTSIDQLIVKNIKPGMVMVKQSALEFSDTLTPASNAADLTPPSQAARGSWAMQVLSPSIGITTAVSSC